MRDLYRARPRAALVSAVLVLAAALAAPPAAGQNFEFDGAASAIVADVLGDVAWADIDSDGDPDLALSGQDDDRERIGAVYRNDDGTLARVSNGISGLGNSSLAWADIDSDGDPDLVLTGFQVFSTPVGQIYRNDGGTLGLDPVNDITNVGNGAVAWADIDSDGDPDLALTGSSDGGFPNLVGELYRNDDGTLVLDAANSSVLANVHIGALAWADYDGDGDPDLALTGQDDDRDPVGNMYRNDGGTLVLDAANSSVLADVILGALAWADYDLDGDPDLALTGRLDGASAGRMYRNDEGTLVLDDVATASIPGAEDGDLAWADYDRDGDPDLAITSNDSGSLLYRNDGGTFVASGLPNGVGGRVAWADYDGDGDPDLALTGFYTVGQEDIRFGEVYRNSTPSVPSIDLTLRPRNPPVVAAPGGSFRFNVTIQNTTDERQRAEVWAVLTFPDGTTALQGEPREVTPRAGRRRSFRVVAPVPADAASGTYSLTVYVGSYPDEAYDSDAFSFTVTGSALASAGVQSWALLDEATARPLLADAKWDDDATDDATTAPPATLALRSPAPNPARGTTTLAFDVPASAHVRLTLYDVVGREVARLVDAPLGAGPHEARLDAGRLAPGVYLVRLDGGGAIATGRLTVAR